MSDASMSFADFVRLVLEALDAANVKYLIGEAVAVWAWGEPRTTRDLDLVVELPFESMAALSQELEQRDMLVPVDIMIDLMIEDRARFAHQCHSHILRLQGGTLPIQARGCVPRIDPPASSTRRSGATAG